MLDICTARYLQLMINDVSMTRFSTPAQVCNSAAVFIFSLSNNSNMINNDIVGT